MAGSPFPLLIVAFQYELKIGRRLAAAAAALVWVVIIIFITNIMKEVFFGD
jgi:hypothetical protein